MNANVSRCGLIGFPPELVQSCATEEVARSLGIALAPCTIEEIVSHHALCDVVAFYVTNETYHDVLEQVRSFVLDMVGAGEIQFLLVSPLLFSLDLEEAWNLGMYSFVPVSDQLDNLYCSLNRYARTRRELDTMDRQLKEASDIAMLSMSASSQLGEIVRFMERSYHCEDYEQLGNLLKETLATMGVASCGVIRCGTENIFFGDPEKQSYLERLLKEQRERGRFVDIENRTTLNFDNLSVMARNLPEPGSEPYGRMKDVLFSLVEGADARIKAIATTRAAAVLDRSKLNFLSVMSHELRTPMNSILGFAGRLKNKKAGDTLTDRDMSALDYLTTNAQRLMNMIENVFELSRIDSDAERARQRLLLTEVITGVVKKHETVALAKQLLFDVQWQDRNVSAEIDPRRLQQIVGQLLDNAIKFTSVGKVGLTISTIYRHDHGQWLQLEVEDTGVGISSVQLNELFKPFGQVDDYMSRGTGGVHLGLALVQKFVNDLNGEIDIHSVEGRGTRVIVRFPQYVTAQAQETVDVELF